MPPKARATPGTHSRPLQLQLAKQQELRCDYVLVKVPPKGTPGGPRVCPLKLNHQVFLQIAFTTLKERCVATKVAADVAALHRFLSRFLYAKAAYEMKARGEAVADGFDPNVRPVMSAAELRLQLLAEYGVDVDTVHMEGVRRSAEGGDTEQLLPHEMSEEEFLQQIAKPSGMAQECCVQ